METTLSRPTLAVAERGTLTRAALAQAAEQLAGSEPARLFVPPGTGHRPVRRLLVLVPPSAGPDLALAERAWRLAAPARLPLMLAGLAHDSASEAQRRRQLASLAALTQSAGVAISLGLSLERDWPSAARGLLRPGDCLVCVANQPVPAGPLGLRRRPLFDALCDDQRVPVVGYGAAGALIEALPRRGRAAAGLAFSLGLIVLFFWLQAWVQAAFAGVPATLLLLLSLGAEFGLLAACAQWQNQA